MTDLSQLTITNPHTWNKDELYTNLQAAVDVELWTIPLYLTALYSIKNLNSNDQSAYPLAAKLIESVVIEEMLHLQLACNLCNALGYSPKINFPVYDAAEGIPFIKAMIPDKYKGFTVQLGGLNTNQLKLFCAIELPEPASQPDWSSQTRYNSIGELYQALQIAINHLWTELYVGEANNTCQQANFSDYLAKFNLHPSDGFSQTINSLPQAISAIHAIVDQGEGSNATHEIPDPYQPPAEPSNPSGYDPSDFDPADSHFKKFNNVLDELLLDEQAPLTYALIFHPNKEQLARQAQSTLALHQAFKKFMHILQEGFTVPQPKQQLPANFYGAMFNLQNLITAVWQSGAVPSFPTHA